MASNPSDNAYCEDIEMTPEQAHRWHMAMLTRTTHNEDDPGVLVHLSPVEFDERAAEALCAGRYAEFGERIHKTLREELHALAEETADVAVANPNCCECYDTGCPRCTPIQG